eukprot:c7557_g1_i1.p1 GENE.c7557_g1_i1~~c7557_g1_i1.p1  ORF type:complete len:289 (-),score=57.00 c7557_g1_i1:129-995(-)
MHLARIAIALIGVPPLILGLACLFTPGVVIRHQLPGFEVDGWEERQVHIVVRYLGVAFAGLGSYATFLIWINPNLLGTVRIYALLVLLCGFLNIFIANNLEFLQYSKALNSVQLVYHFFVFFVLAAIARRLRCEAQPGAPGTQPVIPLPAKIFFFVNFLAFFSSAVLGLGAPGFYVDSFFSHVGDARPQLILYTFLLGICAVILALISLTGTRYPTQHLSVFFAVFMLASVSLHCFNIHTHDDSRAELSLVVTMLVLDLLLFLAASAMFFVSNPSSFQQMKDEAEPPL